MSNICQFRTAAEIAAHPITVAVDIPRCGPPFLTWFVESFGVEAEGGYRLGDVPGTIFLANENDALLMLSAWGSAVEVKRAA